MKTIITLSILFLFLTSCEKKECCDNAKYDINISVLQKDTNIDLLNQSLPGHYDISKVLFEYPYAPNQKWTIALMPYDKPKLYQKDGIYYIRLLPYIDASTANTTTVKIYWTDTDMDVLAFRFKKDKSFTYTEQVFVNNQLAATFPSDEVTILK